jgi:hypothetical protein
LVLIKKGDLKLIITYSDSRAKGKINTIEKEGLGVLKNASEIKSLLTPET